MCSDDESGRTGVQFVQISSKFNTPIHHYCIIIIVCHDQEHIYVLDIVMAWYNEDEGYETYAIFAMIVVLLFLSVPTTYN